MQDGGTYRVWYWISPKTKMYLTAILSIKTVLLMHVHLMTCYDDMLKQQSLLQLTNHVMTTFCISVRRFVRARLGARIPNKDHNWMNEGLSCMQFYVYGGCEWVSSFLVAHHGGCRSLMERLWVVLLGHSYVHRAGQFMEHSRRYTNLGLSDYTVTVLGSGGPRRNIRCEVDLSVLRRASSCT